MGPGEIYYLEEVLDPRGCNPKGRYVIIVTNAEDILPDVDDPILAVCCSSTVYPNLIESREAVELPWHRQGIVRTGLKRRTWAVASWLEKVKPSQLRRLVGVVPGNIMAEIIRRLPPDPDDST